MSSIAALSVGRPEVSIVLPCLNEIDSVGAVVREARDQIARTGRTGEVVVVDNGSTDGSAAAAEAAESMRVTDEPMTEAIVLLRSG